MKRHAGPCPASGRLSAAVVIGHSRIDRVSPRVQYDGSGSNDKVLTDPANRPGARRLRPADTSYSTSSEGPDPTGTVGEGPRPPSRLTAAGPVALDGSWEASGPPDP